MLPPSIEEIFDSLSRGEISFAYAQEIVEEHVSATREGNLRDLFAGLCLQNQKLGGDEAHLLIAERAYRMADAMLEARK